MYFFVCFFLLSDLYLYVSIHHWRGHQLPVVEPAACEPRCAVGAGRRLLAGIRGISACVRQVPGYCVYPCCSIGACATTITSRLDWSPECSVVTHADGSAVSECLAVRTIKPKRLILQVPKYSPSRVLTHRLILGQRS